MFKFLEKLSKAKADGGVKMDKKDDCPMCQVPQDVVDQLKKEETPKKNCC